jgi:hypothetical protein
MPTKTAQAARKTGQLLESLAELYVETLQEIAPRSTERLINSGIEMLEAHRELLAGRIARLQQAKDRLTKSSSAARTRKVAVRRGRSTRRKKTAA